MRGVPMQARTVLAGLALIVAVALAAPLACVDLFAARDIVARTLVLSSRAVRITPAEALHAPGPVSEVCLDLPAGYQVTAGGGPAPDWRVRRPDGNLIAPSVTLL